MKTRFIALVWTLLAVVLMATFAVAQLATPEAVPLAPAITPDQIGAVAQTVLSIVTALAGQFPQLAPVVLIATIALPVLGIVGRTAATLLDGKKAVPKWLSWLPTLSTLGTVNPVAGNNAVDPLAATTPVPKKMGWLKKLGQALKN